MHDEQPDDFAEQAYPHVKGDKVVWTDFSKSEGGVYNGSGSVKATESPDLSIAYTKISARTAVSRPSANRIEFQSGQGRTFFFRLEEE